MKRTQLHKLGNRWTTSTRNNKSRKVASKNKFNVNLSEKKCSLLIIFWMTDSWKGVLKWRIIYDEIWKLLFDFDTILCIPWDTSEPCFGPHKINQLHPLQFSLHVIKTLRHHLVLNLNNTPRAFT